LPRTDWPSLAAAGYRFKNIHVPWSKEEQGQLLRGVDDMLSRQHEVDLAQDVYSYLSHTVMHQSRTTAECRAAMRKLAAKLDINTGLQWQTSQS
jgi:hypothetical protein